MFFSGQTDEDELLNAGAVFCSLSPRKQLKQLEAAIKQKQFSVFLQPKINLNNWKIQGAETLLRWQHPEFGLLLPEHFMSILESSKLLDTIQTWLLASACQLNKHWQKSGLPPLRLTINLPCSQLSNKTFPVKLQEIIAYAKTNPNYLELEITDQCLFENIDTQNESLQAIRSRGTKLSMKYSISGLPITIDLNELPIDGINIDRALTQQISNNRENRQIMSTILGFAKQHNLEVIAEGVETAEQLIFLNAMHCNAVQGFLFSPPLSVKDFTQLYKSGKQFNDIVVKVSRRR